MQVASPEPLLCVVILAPVTTVFSLLVAKVLRSASLITLLFWGGLAVQVLASVLIALRTLAGEALAYAFGGWPPPAGVVLMANRVAGVFLLVGTAVIFVCAIALEWFLRDLSADSVTAYAFMLLFASGYAGIVLTTDLFNVYVMMELLCISSYALISLRRGRAVAAALKYAVFGGLAGLVLALSAGIVYGLRGSMFFGDVSLIDVVGLGVVGSVAALMIVWSLSFFSALFPNHFWLPDAHSEALPPFSAMLSGVSVLSGFYVLVRLSDAGLSFMGFVTPLIQVLALVGALYAAVAMFVQSDVKRMLAYSTVLNVAYVFMGLTAGAGGVSAALLHALTHALGKALAFLSIGILVKWVGSRDIYVLEGVGRAAPSVLIPLTASVLNLVGVPPFPGFVSKVTLYGALMTHGSLPAALVLVLTSGIAALSYVRLLEHLWHAPAERLGLFKLPITMSFALYGLTAAMVLLSMVCTPLVGMLNDALNAQHATYSLVKSVIP